MSDLPESWDEFVPELEPFPNGVVQKGLFVFGYEFGRLASVGCLSQGPNGHWTAIMRTDVLPTR